MTTTSSSSPIEQPQFLHRVIRILAFVLLGYAAINIIESAVAFLVEGSWLGYFRNELRFVARAIQFSTFGIMLLLAVGSAGLLKWKRWARAAVMLWAILHIVLQFAWYALWVVEYSRQLATAPTTQAVAPNDPVWKYLLMSAFMWLANTPFPLLTWLILGQPEVAAMFTRPQRGGFEVVPFAQPIEAGQPR